MKIKEKLLGITRKKRIVLISVIILIFVIFIGIIFSRFNDNIESTSSELIEDKEENMPDVNVENTNFDISEKETTNENVIVTIFSKLENYNLYYYIDTIEEKEMNSENYIVYQDSIEIKENSKIYFKYELDGKYSENPYILEINNINKEEIITKAPENEEATKEELQKEKIVQKDNTAQYYVIVNYSSNVVTVYGKDANNKYTVPVKAMVCSTGVSTPRSGVYKLTTTRYRWRALFGGVYGQYAVKIVGNILFHSVPYLSTDNGTLEYWEYDKLGTAASAGCVRLTVTDALWIYNNCGSGTQVEFSSNSSNPLGKPTVRKISNYQDLRGYDPTDPSSNNPWKNANIDTKVNQTTQNNSNSIKDSTTTNSIPNSVKDTNLGTSEKEKNLVNSSNTNTTKIDNKNSNNITTNNTTTNQTNKVNTQNKNNDTNKNNNVTSNSSNKTNTNKIT